MSELISNNPEIIALSQPKQEFEFYSSPMTKTQVLDRCLSRPWDINNLDQQLESLDSQTKWLDNLPLQALIVLTYSQSTGEEKMHPFIPLAPECTTIQ